ncbi:MAG: bifunctional folylpolyglutamate synthase/dihydrofolate synthase [Proteobacteria bacterium]|nr:MAG: bifunctional folylpolyglutamate synthase/dihydrofolate synthase [Pseudomonadota bacterium]
MDNLATIIEELSNLNPPNQSFDNQLILQALNLISNPQHDYPVIHLAGTNGKGSTASFIESGLIAAGYNVGKYSSPYIHCINECISLNQQMISDVELTQLYLEYKEILIAHNIFLSSFEMLTLIMFAYFSRHKVDYLVLETGLGGKDDATNVVKSMFSVITNVSLEHTQFLGHDLLGIAKHKAGIINHGLTVVGDNSPELIDAVTERTKNYVSIKERYSVIDVNLDRQTFTTRVKFYDHATNEELNVVLGLFGDFQVDNFLCAYTVLQQLGISRELITLSARNVRWYGRLQKLQDKPLMIVDASHNLDGVTKLAQNLVPWFPADNSVIICSILRDKDCQTMLNQYARISQQIIFCPLSNQPRASAVNDLAQIAQGKFKKISLATSPAEALEIAKAMDVPILISGSCYLLKYFM